MGISITRYGGRMSIRTVHTLLNVFKEITDVLLKEDADGNSPAEDLDLSGSICVMQALLDEDVGSFDANEIFTRTVVYGVVMND